MAAASIVVDLLMKTGSFETDTKRAEKALANLEKKAVATGKVLGAAFVTAGAAIAASVKLSIDSFDELSKSSQKIGVSVEALSGLKYAADLSGVSFESLQTSIGRLSKQISDFKDGTKSATEAFARININPSQFATTNEVLLEIADRFSKLPDGAEKTALAMELFGKAGRDLIPFLNAGRDGIKQLTDEAEKLGLVIDTKSAQAAERFNDNMTRLTASITGLRNELAIALLPALDDTANAFVDVIRESQNLKSTTGGSDLGNDLALGFATLADSLSVIPELVRAARLSFSALYADIALLKAGTEVLNPAAAVANALAGTSNLQEFKNALQTRKDIAIDTEKALYEALFVENNKFETAVQERIKFRIDYINQYAKLALQVQQAYINESVEIQQAAQRELAKNLGFNLSGQGSFESPVVKDNAAEKAAEAARRAAEQSARASENFVNALKKEAETLGFTSEQLKRYEANQFNLTATQKGMVDSLLKKISAYKEEEERLKALNEALIEHDRLLRESGDRELENLIAFQSEEERFKQSIRSYVDSIERSIDPTIELADNIGKLQSALSLGEIDDEQYERYVAYLEKLGQKTNETKGFMKELGATFTSAFEDAVIAGKKFSDVLSSLAQDIQRLLTRRFITDPLMSGVDTLINQFASTLFSANGNAFNSSGVMAFASGGVVSGTTPFTYGGGKMGVMGEDGPEAILPLTRIGGDLGVKAVMGAPIVNVNVHEAPGTKTSIEKRTDAGGNVSIEVIVEQVESIMGRNIYKGTGLAPTLERRYGLNRAGGA